MYAKNANNLILRQITDRDEWEGLYEKCNRQYLTQSWLFAEAKKKVEKWHIKRIAIQHNEHVVAICSILEKRILGFTVASRISRGPLFLSAASSIITYGDILRKIRDQYKYFFNGILFIAPALELSNEALDIIKKIGFKKSFHDKWRWRSALVDLKREDVEIRKALDRKWRNHLNSAEKKGMFIKVTTQKEDVDWMIEKHSEHVQEKNFNGPNAAFLKALYEQEPNNFIVLQALYQNHRVAGVILIKHGCFAEYYIGWFGSVGRKLNAGNALLWKSIMVMKEQGVQWLDLGGYAIDDKYGRFKRGIRGLEYQLCGEFICI